MRLRVRVCRPAVWAALAVPLLASAVPAEPPDGPPVIRPEPDGARQPPPGFDTRCSLGATALFGTALGSVARPLDCVTLLRAGEENRCWTVVDTSRVRQFPDAWRDWVRDEKPVLGSNLEVDAYAGTLGLAHGTDPEALDRAARGDLTFVQLFREPAKHRGEIVRVEGRMKRVRRYDDPPEAAREAGVGHIYEGWLFSNDFGANPVCCVFTDLPAGLRVAEKMDERVRFAGYFFKRYRYKAGDTPKPEQWRDAPLLIGRVVAVLPGPGRAAEDWGRPLLPLFLALIVGTVGFVVFLTLLLRRGDRRVRRRLSALAPRPFEDPGAAGRRRRTGRRG